MVKSLFAVPKVNCDDPFKVRLAVPLCPTRAVESPALKMLESFSTTLALLPGDSAMFTARLAPLMINCDVLFNVNETLGRFEVLPALNPMLRFAKFMLAALFRITSEETPPIPLPRPMLKNALPVSDPASMINWVLAPAPPLLTTPPTVTSPVKEYVPAVILTVPSRNTAGPAAASPPKARPL